MNDLISVGNAAATFQKDPRAIEHALQLAGVGPAAMLDGVRYYDAGLLTKAMVADGVLSAQSSRSDAEKGKLRAAEGAKFLAAFGDLGGRYFAEGLTMEQAAKRHARDKHHQDLRRNLGGGVAEFAIGLEAQRPPAA